MSEKFYNVGRKSPNKQINKHSELDKARDSRDVQHRKSGTLDTQHKCMLFNKKEEKLTLRKHKLYTDVFCFSFNVHVCDIFICKSLQGIYFTWW